MGNDPITSSSQAPVPVRGWFHVAVRAAAILVGAAVVLLTLRIILFSHAFDAVFNLLHDRLQLGRNYSTGIALLIVAPVAVFSLWWAVRKARTLVLFWIVGAGVLYCALGFYASQVLVFDRVTGRAQTWYTKLPGGGVKISDEPGYDNGVPRQLADAELAQCIYMARTMQPKKIPIEEAEKIFDTTSGQPRAYWGRNVNGEPELFEGLCFHGETGIRLQAPNAEFLTEVGAARQRAVERKRQEVDTQHRQKLQVINAETEAARAKEAAIDAENRRKADELRREQERRESEMQMREREVQLENARKDAEEQRASNKRWDILSWVLGGLLLVGMIGGVAASKGPS